MTLQVIKCTGVSEDVYLSIKADIKASLKDTSIRWERKVKSRMGYISIIPTKRINWRWTPAQFYQVRLLIERYGLTASSHEYMYQDNAYMLFGGGVWYLHKEEVI